MHRFSLVLGVIVLFCDVHFANASADTIERDVWHAYVEDGNRFGSVHTTVSRQADRGKSYVVESRVLLDLLGQKQEIVTSEEYRVSADLKPVSVRSTIRQLSGTVEIAGHVEDDVLVIERKSHGFKRTVRIELSEKTIFRACLSDWLDRQSKDAKEVSVRIIDDESLTAEQAVFQRLESDGERTVWQASLRMGAVAARGRIVIEGGVRIREQFEAPKFELARCTAKQAGGIRHKQFAPRDVLMFPIKKNITRPDELTSLTVKLQWRNIALDKFHATDARQKIISHAADNARHKLVVRISPDSQVESPVKLPVSDKQFQQYLAETRYVKPTDPRISAKAYELIEETDDALQATKALSKGVFDLLNGGVMIAETLSGPEVLECRKGKCSEYSTLFASLARSVGIPTRIVLGDRLISGRWIGHMWNEVWVGRWLTVDATTNEVGSAPALLKFTHSNAVMGTQHLRWALTESLEVSIEDFTLKASTSNTGWKTGIAGHVYSNADFGCRLAAPVEKWKIEDNSKPGRVILRFRIPDEDDVQIHFVAYSLPAAFDAKTIAGIRVTQFTTMYKEYKSLSRTTRMLNGREWQLLQFERKPLEGEQKRIKNVKKMKTTEYLWHQGSSGFLINLIAEEAAHDRFEKPLQKLLARFEMQTPAVKSGK